MSKPTLYVPSLQRAVTNAAPEEDQGRHIPPQLLSSRLQRCWFGLQSRRLRADPAGCSSTGEFQSEDVFLATPFSGVLMHLFWWMWSGCQVSSTQGLQVAGHSFHCIPRVCMQRGLLLATLANTLLRKFCRSNLSQFPSISNYLEVYSCQFHQMLPASTESCFFSNF